jgi:ribosomal protein S18 acetylase RimI-like enzyme
VSLSPLSSRVRPVVKPPAARVARGKLVGVKVDVDVEAHELAVLREPRFLDDVLTLYRAAFCVEPWNDTEDDVAQWRRRTLADDADRPGARLVTARHDGELVGFATAWRTPSPFPTGGRSYDAIAQALGSEMVENRLAGTIEVDELAVAPRARRAGLAGTMLVAAVPPGAEGWLVTSTKATAAVGLYRSVGWDELRGTAEDGAAVVVFTSSTTALSLRASTSPRARCSPLPGGSSTTSA